MVTIVSYGSFSRMFNPESIPVNVRPVRVDISDAFAERLGWHINAADIHHCVSFEHVKPDNPKEAVRAMQVKSIFNKSEPADQFFNRFSDPEEITLLLPNLETDASLNFNMENAVWRAHQFPAAGLELSFQSTFRTVMAASDFLYPFLTVAQRFINGRFPSNRFEGTFHRAGIWLHVLCGSVVLYVGCYLHLQNEIDEVYESEDGEPYRQALYYILGVFTLVHTFTVFFVLSRVMGEKRITIPLYLFAGVVNGINAAELLADPTLKNAFLVWGSMNIFVFVRWQILLLCFSYIDWELIYTYSILAAAAFTYPLTGQNEWHYMLLVGPIVYGPFHERICGYLGWHVEDDLGGNEVSEKHVSKLQSTISESRFSLSAKSRRASKGAAKGTNQTMTQSHESGSFETTEHTSAAKETKRGLTAVQV